MYSDKSDVVYVYSHVQNCSTSVNWIRCFCQDSCKFECTSKTMTYLLFVLEVAVDAKDALHEAVERHQTDVFEHFNRVVVFLLNQAAPLLLN